jgi:hypothetical protein
LNRLNENHHANAFFAFFTFFAFLFTARHTTAKPESGGTDASPGNADGALYQGGEYGFAGR